MKGFGGENKQYKISEKTPKQPSKEEIINQAIRLHLKQNIINIVLIKNIMITEFFQIMQEFYKVLAS